jgi:hypothetical protein
VTVLKMPPAESAFYGTAARLSQRDAEGFAGH